MVGLYPREERAGELRRQRTILSSGDPLTVRHAPKPAWTSASMAQSHDKRHKEAAENRAGVYLHPPIDEGWPSPRQALDRSRQVVGRWVPVWREKVALVHIVRLSWGLRSGASRGGVARRGVVPGIARACTLVPGIRTTSSPSAKPGLAVYSRWVSQNHRPRALPTAIATPPQAHSVVSFLAAAVFAAQQISRHRSASGS